MKKLTMTLMALFLVATLSAQVEDEWVKKMKEQQKSSMGDYEKFKQKAYQDYENFRKKANEEYAKFMEEAWKRYNAEPAEEPPAKPKPPIPPVEEDKPAPTPTPNPTPDAEKHPIESVKVPDPVTITSIPKPDLSQADRPKPMEPIIPGAMPVANAQTVSLYGSAFPIHLESEALPTMKDASERSVAKMWRKLSEPAFDHIIAECLQQRESHNLCDWAYVRLTQQVAEKQFGKGTNEAIVMQMYLLTQSGYQMRIGRDDNEKLLLLIGSKEKIFRYRFFVIDGIRFYILDKKNNSKSMNIYDHAFPKEKSLSLVISQPSLNVDKTEARTITSKRYPEVSIPVQTNKNLIAFYNDYPINFNWQYYSIASLSPVIKETLYPALRKAIEGKTDQQAANILINFVQTGFRYQTDQEQFGYERPLYPDETFFYPYSDCEDRSILFSCLVRELLGLDVVLLDYPEHIATAIYFKQPVEGDYVVVDGKNYVISDPTYIGATVGMCAPMFKSVSPKVIKF